MKSFAVVIVVSTIILSGFFLQSVIAQEAGANATVVEPAAPEAPKAPIIPGNGTGNSTGNGTDTVNGQPSITGSAVLYAFVSSLVVARMFYQKAL